MAKLRSVVEGGLHWLRLLAARPLTKSYRDAWITRYALSLPAAAVLKALDAASARYLRSMAGRVPDARRLDAAFFTMNGVISIVFFACVFAERLLAWRSSV